MSLMISLDRDGEYYDAPILALERDVHHLITDEAASLSNQIGQANAQRIADDTQYVLSNIERGIHQPIANLLYSLLSAWGRLSRRPFGPHPCGLRRCSHGALNLLGPVFIPF